MTRSSRPRGASRPRGPYQPDLVQLVRVPTKSTPGVVVVQVDGGDPDLYTIVELPPEGPGSRLFDVVGIRPRDAGTEKATRRHSTLVEAPVADRPAEGTCTCERGTYGSPRANRCRHIRFLAALWGRGQI